MLLLSGKPPSNGLLLQETQNTLGQTQTSLQVSFLLGELKKLSCYVFIYWFSFSRRPMVFHAPPSPTPAFSSGIPDANHPATTQSSSLSFISDTALPPALVQSGQPPLTINHHNIQMLSSIPTTTSMQLTFSCMNVVPTDTKNISDRELVVARSQPNVCMTTSYPYPTSLSKQGEEHPAVLVDPHPYIDLDEIKRQFPTPTLPYYFAQTTAAGSGLPAQRFTEPTCLVTNLGTYPYAADVLELQSLPPPSGHVAGIFQQHPSHSPLKLRTWIRVLADHPDQDLRDYLLQGLHQGFNIGFDYNQPLQSSSSNMPSALCHPDIVQAYLDKECQLGRIIGPLKRSEITQVHTSRFGVIPKKHQANKWRLILDLSSPTSKSVNDGISQARCSLKCASIDDAARIVLTLGRGTLLAKVDIESAYRIIPVSPQDQHLLGMEWKGHIYVDTALPFGLRSAPKIFCALSDTIEWILQQRGVSSCLHYIDDFITFGRADSHECQTNLTTILDTCKELGIPLAQHKIEGPAQALTFLGIEINTSSMTLLLPKEKLARLKVLVARWMSKNAATKREMLSLIGQLSHACKVVIPGRSFLRQLIDLASSRPNLDHWIRLNEAIRTDICWWHLFMENWNGASLISTHSATSVDTTIVTDASGTWGCGAFQGSHWFQCQWPDTWAAVNIAAKEFIPILLAIGTWGHLFRGSQVLLKCDNMAVVSIINSKKCTDKLLAQLLRCLHYLCARHDIAVVAEHIQGKLNTAADALSRNNLPLFLSSIPQADPSPTTVSQHLKEWVMNSTPNWLSPSWRSKLKNCC